MASPATFSAARGWAHLQEGRNSRAIGAFRAALGIDPTALTARLGLVEAMVASGRREDAADELVAAAEGLVEEEAHNDAISLYGKALALDPRRLELHLEVALIEDAMGKREAAVKRVEGLAERYMDDGRLDEAAELMRFVASWGEGDAADDEPGSVASLVVEPFMSEPIRVEMAAVHGEITSIAPNPLRTGTEGELMAGSIEDGVTVRPEPRVVEPSPGPFERWDEMPESTPIAISLDDVRDETEGPSARPTTGVNGMSAPRPARHAPIDRSGARFRLRASHEDAVTMPYDPRGHVTAPISTLQPSDEDVTLRFRRPSGLDGLLS